MKKVLITLLMIIGISSTAFATISVVWQSAFGIDDPAVPGVTYDLPIGSLVQLIWSPDNVIDPIDPFNPTVAQGNDIVIDNHYTIVTGAFGTIGTYPENVGPLVGITEPVLLSGYVYIRVFNSPTPTIGNWYGESDLVGGPLTDQDPIPAPPDIVDIAPVELFTLNKLIVPEPGALALAALGAGVVAVRRMRRS
jgi:hypothetical protein